MSNTNWTKEQTAAIMNRNTNLLLSAAAGSGKTAVLVQRILTLITDTTQPIDITDLLVLTFTKAAATEMRTRITSELLRLLENAEQEKNTLQAAHINRQLALIESAHISTINAFCQSLIKQYFYRIPLDPKYKIVSDESILYLLKQEVLSEVLLDWYSKNDSHFIKLSDMLANRYQDSHLRNTILSLHAFSQSMAFPKKWLNALHEPYKIESDETLSSLSWVNDILENSQLQIKSCLDSYKVILDVLNKHQEDFSSYNDCLSTEYDMLCNIASSQTWEEWQQNIITSPFAARLPAISKKKALYPENVDEVKKQITHIDKGHVHNHIIFCAVDMVNQRKYISNKQSYAYIRRTSDRLCKENGLSVVKPGQSKGKSYAEWDAQRKGTSWKAKLKAAIDAAIPQAKDFDDFLRLMQAQGYEIKPGKFI